MYPNFFEVKVNLRLLSLLFFNFCLIFKLLLVCLLMSGCLANQSLDLSKSPKSNLIEALPDQKQVVNSVLTELQFRYDLTTTLYMQMKVLIEEKGKREEVRETLWYKRSETGQDQLHIQAMGLYNQPRAIMLANNAEFLLYLVNEQESIRATLEDAVLQEIFGLDLRISDVKSAIFANPFLDRPIGDNFQIRPLSLTDKKLHVRCNTDGGQLVEEMMILNYAEAPIVRWWKIWEPTGELIQETYFSDYREVDSILRPRRISIHRPKEETRIGIKTIKPQIGGKINDQKFDFDRFPK